MFLVILLYEALLVLFFWDGCVPMFEEIKEVIVSMTLRTGICPWQEGNLNNSSWFWLVWGWKAVPRHGQRKKTWSFLKIFFQFIYWGSNFVLVNKGNIWARKRTQGDHLANKKAVTGLVCLWCKECQELPISHHDPRGAHGTDAPSLL